MASSPAQGQEDVAAAIGPAVGCRPLDDLAVDPRRPDAVPRDGDQARPRAARAARRRRHAAIPGPRRRRRRPTRPLASSTRCAPTTCSPSRRSARSWSTTSRSGCAASAAPSRAAAPPAPARPSERSNERRPADGLGRWAAVRSPTGRVGGLGPTGQVGVTAVSTVRSVTRGPGRNTRPLLAHLRARPGSPSTVRVSGTANAGVWGAGVRMSWRGTARRGVSRPVRTATPSDLARPRTVEQRRQRSAASGVTASSAGPPQSRADRLAEQLSQSTTSAIGSAGRHDPAALPGAASHLAAWP